VIQTRQRPSQPLCIWSLYLFSTSPSGFSLNCLFTWHVKEKMDVHYIIRTCTLRAFASDSVITQQGDWTMSTW
jgi:hypothetical protein